jgi:multiple antibiotic resistance protein
MWNIDIVAIFSAFMVLFAVIDITGSIPIIIELKKKHGEIEATKATLVATITLFAFLFVGKGILGIFGVDIASFAIAGSFILLFLALEMILGIELFKSDENDKSGASIVPLAFPMIAGAGSITSLLSLKSEYDNLHISIALLLNMLLVYVVLKNTSFVERMLGQGGIMVLKKVFGIILLSIAIKLFVTNTGIQLSNV